MKICSQCHKKNLGDAKFCVFCGFNLTNVTPVSADPQPEASKMTSQPDASSADNQQTFRDPHQNDQNNQSQSSEAQADQSAAYNTKYAPNNGFNQFLSYFKDSLVNPHNAIAAPKYGGLMSIGVYAILMLIIFNLGAKRMIDLVVAQSPSEYTVSVFAPIKTAIMQFSGILIISSLVYILVAFTVRRTLLNDNIAFLDFTDMFGIYINISSILLLLCLILSLFVSVTSFTLMETIAFIFALSQLILNYATVMTLKDITGRFNNFYAILIAEIVPAIISLWVTSVYLQSIYGNLISWYNQIGE